MCKENYLFLDYFDVRFTIFGKNESKIGLKLTMSYSVLLIMFNFSFFIRRL